MLKSRQSKSQPEQRGHDQPTVPHQARTTPREVPDKATAKARIMPLARSTIFPLTKHSQPYIPPDFLRSFPNIEVCSDKLSFDDGTLPSAYEQFLQPLPRDHVDELLRHTQPWHADGVLSDFIPDTEIGRWNDNYHDALVLCRALAEHMGHNGTGDPEHKTIISHYTHWKCFNNGNKWLTRIREEGPDGKYNLYWQAQALFRPCLSDSTIFNPVLDTEKPHVNCFVADNEPHREDCLSTSEVQSVLWLASEAATDPAYMQHWVFPVTIVSACMFNVRIVQAIVRLGSNTVEIRKSDIMDLSPGLTDEATQDRFRRLLAWLLGTPMGNTTKKS